MRPVITDPAPEASTRSHAVTAALGACRAHRVVALVADDLSPFELTCVGEVFGREAPDGVSWWYDLVVAADSPRPRSLRTPLGFSVRPDAGIDAVDDADTLVVPAWGSADRPPPHRVLERIVAAHQRGARIMSICSGAYVLAWAGLLDGRRATTHWKHAAALAERFPRVEVDPDVLYVDEGQVLTSAGSAAGLDLCLHVVRRDHGVAAANHVARSVVVPPHRDGGQAQYVDHPVDTDADEPKIARTLDWALGRLAEPLEVEALAAHAAMSPRHFARRFREVTGTTPHRWLVDRRVDAARHLLEATSWPIDRIATEVGFGTAASLRARFVERVRLTPTAYRRTFAAGRDGPVEPAAG